MKQFMKKIISTICVCAMLVVPMTNMAFAAQYFSGRNISTSANAKIYEKMTNAELIKKMKALGMTQDEINYLLKLEKERIARANTFPSSNQFSIMKKPSNPKIGDRYTEKKRIYFSTASITVFGLASLFVGNGIAIGAALVLAEAVSNEITERTGAKGVDVVFEYYYGPTNEGEIGWSSAGVKSWKIFY